jgi:hypothetical protein
MRSLIANVAHDLKTVSILSTRKWMREFSYI